MWRFYLFYNRPEKADALFTWKDFQEKINGELIGNLGNLVNRTLSFVRRYYDGTIPEGTGNPVFWERVRKFEADITEKLERAELRDAFRTVFDLSSFANKTFQDGEPWKTRTADPPAAAALIRDLCFVVRDIAVMIHPYIPASAERIASFFGLTIESQVPSGTQVSFEGKKLSWADIGRPEGLSTVEKSEVLFPRLEDDLIQELRERYSGSQKDRSDRETGRTEGDPGNIGDASGIPSGKALSLPERFAQTLDLRVARIVKIERHPQADKLYIETLEIAGEERTIVSGLVPFYTEAELLGKHIILAYNLKAAKLRGVESRGMLLAASAPDGEGGERVEVLDAGDTPTGTPVRLRDLSVETLPPEIDIDAFFSVPITVVNHEVRVAGSPLLLGENPLRTKVIGDGEVH
jgi:methionyl-tRNA synthetase